MLSCNRQGRHDAPGTAPCQDNPGRDFGHRRQAGAHGLARRVPGQRPCRTFTSFVTARALLARARLYTLPSHFSHSDQYHRRPIPVEPGHGAGAMQALTFQQLSKTYKNGVQALKGIDLAVEEGDFFALLGPNGAGKTTAIGIVTSLVNKTGGKVQVFGHDIDTELAIAKSCIGLVPQEINFNQFETVTTILLNQAG